MNALDPITAELIRNNLQAIVDEMALTLVRTAYSANLKSAMDPKRDFLRHTLATIAYRGGKVLRGVPADFADFRASDTTRTPGEILAHLGDLLDWSLVMAEGRQAWQDSKTLSWPAGSERFFAALSAFDNYLASDQPLGVPEERLFQGPIADALTHIGQIAILRRMAGVPVRGENYFAADIVAGRVGTEQAAAKTLPANGRAQLFSMLGPRRPPRDRRFGCPIPASWA